MDLRCPKCNSTDVKKVSVAHEEGLYRVDTRTRLRAAVVGGNGPDLVVGRATTRGSEQSALSKKLGPPVKWSYLKVVFWSGVMFLCVSWLVSYVNTIRANPSTVLSAPLILFALISATILVLLLFLVWRHNHSIYGQRYVEWDSSFICSRCGNVSQQEFGQERSN